MASEENFEHDYLLNLYQITQAEITRYRDREWALPGLFVAAMATTIGFILTNIHVARAHSIAISCFLGILALGNLVFLIYTHKRLTEQRVIQKWLEYSFVKHKLVRKGRLPYPPEHIVDWNRYNHFRGEFWNNQFFIRGFYSHILPFIIMGGLLFIYGLFILGCFPYFI